MCVDEEDNVEHMLLLCREIDMVYELMLPYFLHDSVTVTDMMKNEKER